MAKPNPKRLLALLEENAQSQAKKAMRDAYRYYVNDNDIWQRKRQYVGSDGIKVEEPLLSNSKLPHPFFPKIVDQKIGYLLSNPMSISCLDDPYAEALQGYFDKRFMRLLKAVGLEAILCGCAWLQVYYNQEGKLSFIRIPSQELIPLWADGAHTKLMAMVRVYQDNDPLGEESDVQQVEYYTDKTCIRYELKGGKLTELESTAHITILAGEEVMDADFGRIPFVPFRYNGKEVPLITRLKALIDEYDELSAVISDNIKDTPHDIKIIRGYTGKLGEFNHNVATYRAINLDENGSVEQLTTTLDTTACEAQLGRLRRDIYDAACAVDAQDAAQGNTSGVAIRLRYADLDMDCASMGAEFAAALDELLHFIDADLIAKGQGDYRSKTADFLFNTDVSVNEMEVIQACAQSQGLISKRSIVANHPWVTDVEDELEEMEGDAADAPNMPPGFMLA